jgi:HEAT repeat protein
MVKVDFNRRVNHRMASESAAQIAELMDMLNSYQSEERVVAIEALGEIGDEAVLATLRQRLKTVGQEHAALIAAVGKLKRKLGVK